MSVALIADSHLGGAGGPAAEMVSQLGTLPEKGCRRLVLLGDIFHVWIGDRRFETESITKVVRALRELAQAGVRIDYVEGNRDFFLEGSPYADLFASISTELVVEAAGKRYLLVHGDGLNREDRQYLFWRWLSKSWLSRLLILHLPRRIAGWALDRTEASLARTNFKHRGTVPTEAITAWAEPRLKEGYEQILLGHFHEPLTWAVGGGEVRILDAWFNSRRVEWLGREGEAAPVSDP